MTLEVQQLSKHYGKGEQRFTAVNELSFQAFAGETVGILGPNGSGKTTTLKTICGLTTADEGVIRVQGQTLPEAKKRYLGNLGVVLEGARNVYWRLSVEENLVYFAGLKGISRHEAKSAGQQLIQTLGLEQYKGQEVRKLSKGNQQKAAIACAAIHNPPLLLLDEPTLGLDVEVVAAMHHWLKTIAREQNSCTLVTSHDLDFIEKVCDRVIILFRGRLLSEDTVSGLRSRFCPQRKIDLVVSNSPDEVLINKLKTLADWRFEAMPGEEDRSALQLRTPELSVLAPALKLLQDGGHQLLDISVSQDSLEDIFLNITREAH